MYCDLHIHSTYSDSSRTPEEIVRVARQRDVTTLAICDHGTFAAYERLRAACRGEGIECIPGIELGATLGGEDYHMLAYGFDREIAELLDFIQRQRQISDIECEGMIRRMSADFPQVSVEEYRAYAPPADTGGWKYLHYAVSAGAFSGYAQAGAHIFSAYFQAHPETFPLDRFCALVRRAGGVPVLAHPGDSHPDRGGFPAFLEAMLRGGIGGIECYYPTHDAQTTAFCVDFCRRMGLCITGGSDCHGIFDDESLHTIGAGNVTRDMLSLRGIA